MAHCTESKVGLADVKKSARKLVSFFQFLDQELDSGSGFAHCKHCCAAPMEVKQARHDADRTTRNTPPTTTSTRISDHTGRKHKDRLFWYSELYPPTKRSL